jgi:hypothetical protein
MIDTLPDEILFIIFSKLPNYEIISLMNTNSSIKATIKVDFFLSYLLRRWYPIVFNSNDLYCKICNIHIYRINDKNKTFLKYNH